jgi:para-nitrobenzyl esterase
MQTRFRTLLTAIAATCAALALTAACTTGSTEPTGPPADESIVETTGGLVQGTVTDGHRRFQAVPYAAPPVGELRWQAPQPAQPWSGIRDGTQAGTFCPQSWETGPDGRPVVQGSEDCLFLNVDTPAPADRPLPVMVFVHGGGFTGGQGAPYDPARVTDHGGVIVVTLNYRLGALGFLAHPALQDPTAGNFGLADQQAALRWVQQNIAAFGGDPGNVTLWGESAGAFSVCSQLASPGARGLFHKAIVQSGPCSNDVLTRETAEQRGVTTAARLGCPDDGQAAACLRARPFAELVGLGEEELDQAHRNITSLPWFPVGGTEVLPLQPIEALRTGQVNDVPLIHGTTRDEMRFWVGLAYDAAGRPVTAEQYPQIVEELYGAAAGAVAAEYPAAGYPTPSIALATLLTDEGRMVGTCSQLDLFDAVRSPVYGFEFAEPVPGSVGTMPLGRSTGPTCRTSSTARSRVRRPPHARRSRPRSRSG